MSGACAAGACAGACAAGGEATGADAGGAWAAGACAGGACAAGAWAAGAAGVGTGRLLLTRRDGRAGASGAGPEAGGAAAAATLRAGAFLTGAAVGAAELDADATRFPVGAIVVVAADAAADVGGRRLHGFLGLGRLRRGGGLLGLDGAAEPFGVGLAADAVGLRVLDGGRVALDPDAQGKGQLEPFLVGES